jgi:hypothetical protein
MLNTAGEGIINATVATDVDGRHKEHTPDAIEAVKQSQAPIKGITHIHRTICTALEEFSREANALQLRADVTAGQLASLMEQHRWVRTGKRMRIGMQWDGSAQVCRGMEQHRWGGPGIQEQTCAQSAS